MNTENSHLPRGGDLALTCAIIFLLLWSFPVMAALLGDYEPDMLLFPFLIGLPCLAIGTVAGLIGVARHHPRASLALKLMWIPVGVFILLGVVVAIAGGFA